MNPQYCSFRAERCVDLYKLFGMFADMEKHPAISRVSSTSGDVSVGLLSYEHSGIDHLLDLVAGCLLKIEDGHVMLETLQPVPLAENTLERTYNGAPEGFQVISAGALNLWQASL